MKLLLALATITIHAAGLAAQATRVGGEFQVNTYQADAQTRAKVAVGSDGRFVVVWSSSDQDGNLGGVFGRRYSSSGVAIGTEFLVNVITVSDQSPQAVAIDQDGDFVVVWTLRVDGSNNDVHLRRFSSSGVALGGELKANTYTPFFQDNSSISMALDGSFVLTWMSYPQDGENNGIFARRFSSTGSSLGREFQVNLYTDSAQRAPSIAMASDGSFVVAWHDFRSGYSDVFARRFDSAGVGHGQEIHVNVFHTGNQSDPSIGADSGGAFVVAWQSPQDGGSSGIFARRFSALGLPQAVELRVNTRTLGEQSEPSIAVDGDGDFVVTWQSEAQDDPMDYGVFARRFDAAGVAEGVELQVNGYTVSHQQRARVSANRRGDFVIAWESDQNGSFEVLAQRFSVPTLLDVDGNGSVRALTDGHLFLRDLFGFGGTSLVNGAVADDCSRCTAGPIESHLASLTAISRVDADGPELQVNSYTPSNQYHPTIAAASAGNFVVAWTSLHDGSDSGIFARRFHATGAFNGPELQVNVEIDDEQRYPGVGIRDDGQFVVVWESNLQDGSTTGIFGRRFDFEGTPLADEFQINTRTSGIQERPVVAMNGAGGAVAAWAGADGSSRGVFAQRFDSSGEAVGIEFQVNTYTLNTQSFASVAMRSDGSFLVGWASDQDGDLEGIFARRFAADGAPAGVEFRVNTYTPGAQTAPRVAARDSGFVIAWTSNGQDGSEEGVFARRLDINGNPQGGAFQVHAITAGRQAAVAAGMDAEGRFIVAWEGENSDGNGYGVLARRFSSSGVAIGTEFQVNSYFTQHQRSPTVSSIPEGDFVIAWRSTLQDGGGDGIFLQRFDAVRAADIDGNGEVDPLTDGVLTSRYMFGFRGAILIDNAVGSGCTRCTAQKIEGYLAGMV